MIARGSALILAVLFVLTATFVFGKVEGGFLAWFLFDFTLVLSLYELITWFVGLSGIETSRSVSTSRLSAGQSLDISVGIQRRGLWPTFWLRVANQLPQPWLFLVHGSERTLQPLWNKHLSVSYRVTGLQRGIYAIGNTVVETGDLLGLVRRRREFVRKQTVIVYPKVVPVRGWTGYHPEELGLRQPTSRRSEESTNVLGVRDYVPGDRLSKIHWAASARRGSLQAKEFELHVSSELMFVPDLSSSSYQVATAIDFELEMTITASLMKHAYELRRRFAATLHGQTLTRFPAGSGEALFLRCMEALALADANGDTAFPSSLARIAQETPAGTSLVVISPRIDRASAVAAEMASRRTKVEWFVPIGHEELTDEDKLGFAMLQAARVNVHLIRTAEQLGSLQRGGAQRATNV